MAFRQCPRRLWLEIHKPELREDSDATRASFDVGHTVGELARQLYDPNGRARPVAVSREAFEASFAQTAGLLAKRRPIFEARFISDETCAFADVLFPKRGSSWRMIEV